MSEIILLPNGETISTDEPIGLYKYIAYDLQKAGIGSKSFSMLEKLYELAKTQKQFDVNNIENIIIRAGEIGECRQSAINIKPYIAEAIKSVSNGYDCSTCEYYWENCFDNGFCDKGYEDIDEIGNDCGGKDYKNKYKKQ